MEQIENDARLIASHILERDGYEGYTRSRLFQDLCEMAKALLKAPERPWYYCDERQQ
jgi:hypothetical protein